MIAPARPLPARHFLREAETLLFGHRGCSRLAPENTLAAFGLLLERRVPGVELDIHLCATGEPVVIHDFTLPRVTGADGRVEDTPLKALRELDAGAWFGPQFAGERIPMLDEVFDLLGREVYYDLELKSDNRGSRGLEEAVLTRIVARGLRDRCLISSFNPFCLREVNRLDPGLPAGLIYSRHREIPFLLRHGEGRFLARVQVLKPHHPLIRPWTVPLQRLLAGRQVIAWTVDDPAAAARLLRLGVRGIVSNDPEGIRR